MNQDKISEVCSEVRMLAHYANSIETTKAEDFRSDEAILISGLSLLSAHAERLIEKHSTQLSNFENPPAHSSQALSATLPTQITHSPKENSAHGWFFDVLGDLLTYARQNELSLLCQDLEQVGKNFMKQQDVPSQDQGPINDNSGAMVIPFERPFKI